MYFVGSVGTGNNWYNMSLLCKVKNGPDIDFWRDCWIGKESLCNQFSMLYQALQEPKMRILEAGFLVHNFGHCSFCNIRDILFVSEAVEYDNLPSILHHIQPILNQQNLCVWWSTTADFSVKSTFERLCACKDQNLIFSTGLLSSLKYDWKSNVPSNIQGFAWRLFHRKLLTRDELAKRGVIFGVYNLVYSLCIGAYETHHHLLIICHVDVEVWLSILDWVGVNLYFFSYYF